MSDIIVAGKKSMLTISKIFYMASTSSPSLKKKNQQYINMQFISQV